MAKKQNPSKEEQNKADTEKMQKRVENLLPPKAEIPASISIQQAEELKARVSELEAELARKQQPESVKTVPDKDAALAVDSVSTFQKESKQASTSGSSKSQKTRTSLGAAVLSFIQHFGQSRIQTRLTALIFIAVIPLLTGIVIFLTSISASGVETGANTALQGTSQGLGTNVSTWLELNINALRGLTLLPDIVSMDATRQKQALQAMAEAYPYMYLVSTTDVHGVNVARNDDAALTDYSDREWYKGAIAGAPITYQILIGKTSGQPALVVSMPIKNANGKIVGVSMFAAELTALSDQTRVTPLGKNGYTYIVDANNQLLAHPDQAFTANELRDLSNYPPVAAIRNGETDVINFTDENGQSWRAYTSVLDNGWAVIAQQPESEILAPVRQFKIISTLIVVLGGGLIIALTWFAIRRTLQPIAALTDTITAISAGDLNRTIDVKSRDEIGVLATTFNNMTSQLRDMIGNLERRVEERTHNLELASDVGRTITENIADVHQMLTKAVETIRVRFDLYYTQIYLVDSSGRTITLRAGTGEVGKQLLSKVHRLPIGPGSLNGRAVAEKRAVIMSDTSQSADFLPNPLLPNTRSEMVVPLMANGQVIGVLDMQSELPGTFSEASLPAFEVLAGQFSVAIQNANLFAETTQAHHQLEANARHSTGQGWQDFLDGIERAEQIGFAYKQNETVALDDLQAPLSPDTLSTPITITGATVGAIQTAFDRRGATSSEQEILQAAAGMLGQHIENLRLLNQAEQYHRQAQQAIRRLTRENWDAYLQSSGKEGVGFAYNLNEVYPLSNDGKNHDQTPTLTQPLIIRDEVIGEFSVNHEDSTNEEVDELLSIVTTQLSAHIENLRLSANNMSLLKSTEERAQREQMLRQITNTLRSSTNPATIMRTAVRELGNALGRKTIIEMTDTELADHSKVLTNTNGSSSSEIDPEKNTVRGNKQ